MLPFFTQVPGERSRSQVLVSAVTDPHDLAMTAELPIDLSEVGSSRAGGSADTVPSASEQQRRLQRRVRTGAHLRRLPLLARQARASHSQAVAQVLSD